MEEEKNMKTFKESTLDYRCIDGCGVEIYNTTYDYGVKCTECGGKLVKVTPKKNKLRGKNNES